MTAVTAIPLSRASLCADCDTIHDQPDGACPRCTCTHSLLVSTVLLRRRPLRFRSFLYVGAQN